MHEFLARYNITPIKFLQFSGIAMVVVLALLVLSPDRGGALFPLTVSDGSFAVSQRPLYGGGESYAVDGYQEISVDTSTYGASSGIESSAYNLKSMRAPSLTVAPPIPSMPETSGDDAETYDVTQYSASITTGDIAGACAAVSRLKSEEPFIFEQSTVSEQSCYFTFKTTKDSVERALALIEGLSPDELTEYTHSIKKQVEYLVTEESVLLQKLAAVDETLTEAQKAYGEITKLAAESKDATVLARVIESRLAIIERLSQEKIQVVTQLDRLARSRAEQLDRLEYVYFTVNIYEDTVIDGEGIESSWKEAFRTFVYEISTRIQMLFFGLIVEFVNLLRYGIYLVVLFFVIKFAWKWGRQEWNR